MSRELLQLNKIYHGDCTELMINIADESVDVILTDPPYLYLKNQKLDVPFDEEKFFNHAKRVLKPSGFIVLFGRGESFYRWNNMLIERGFKFKEEIVWDKCYTSSPVLPISRVHELISVYTKKNGIIKDSVVPYTELKAYKMDSIIQDVKRIKSALNNTDSLSDLLLFLEKGEIIYSKGKESKHKTTLQSIRIEQDRAVKTLSAITNGMKEKSILTVKREHYSTIHPTQKPVRLIERLIQIVSKKGQIIVDPFSGSASTAIASINTGINFILIEKDREYFDLSQKRLSDYLSNLQTKLF